jgi:hypothetical protein
MRRRQKMILKQISCIITTLIPSVSAGRNQNQKKSKSELVEGTMELTGKSHLDSFGPSAIMEITWQWVFWGEYWGPPSSSDEGARIRSGLSKQPKKVLHAFCWMMYLLTWASSLSSGYRCPWHHWITWLVWK